MPQTAAASVNFTRLVSRTVAFSDRVTRNAVLYVLDDDGGLVLRINKVFVKRVQLLRIHAASAAIFDQDDYGVSVPFHQFARSEERLRDMSRSIGVPAFTVVGDLASIHHTVATRDLSFVTLDMLGGTGTLTVSWTRPSGSTIETLNLWDPAQAPCVLCSSLFRAQPLVQQQLRTAGAWAASRSVGVFLIVETASVEGQALLHETWPQLNMANRAVVLLVPASPSETTYVLNHGGAAAGYSTALALQKLLTEHFDPKDGPLQMAFADMNLARSSSTAFDMVLPIIREHLVKVPLAGAPLSFPCDALENACKFITQTHCAYVEALKCDMSRPYVHSLVGDGAEEADISEALESVACRLEKLQRCTGFVAAQNSLLPRIELVLPAANASSLSQPRRLRKLSRKAMMPVGKAAATLAHVVQTSFDEHWCVSSSGWQNDCLAVIDLTDAQAVSWLRQVHFSAGSEDASVHVLLLVPGSDASQMSWEAVAEPLALLVCGGEDGEDILDLGLALVASLDCMSNGCAQLLPIFDALANVRLQDIAFQLRPNPRVGLCMVATEALESDGLTTLIGDAIGLNEVLASFSLWPASEEYTPCCKASNRGLLSAKFLVRENTQKVVALPLSVGRAGMVYESSLATKARDLLLPFFGTALHFCACRSAEVALYRRTAGDFQGREENKFEWRGDSSGPQARLWQLAADLCSTNGSDAGLVLFDRLAPESQASSSRSQSPDLHCSNPNSCSRIDFHEDSRSESTHNKSPRALLPDTSPTSSIRRDATDLESSGYSDDEFHPE